jgi:hypothetical protein
MPGWGVVVKVAGGVILVVASFVLFFAFGDRSVFGLALDHLPGLGEDAGAKADQATGWVLFPAASAAEHASLRDDRAADAWAQDLCEVWGDGRAEISYEFTKDSLICSGRASGQVATLTVKSTQGSCDLMIVTTLDGEVVREKRSSFEALDLPCPSR